MRLTLKAARVNRGMTQEEVAKALCVNKKTVGAWENGVTFPKADKIDPLCALYGVKYDDILWRV